MVNKQSANICWNAHSRNKSERYASTCTVEIDDDVMGASERRKIHQLAVPILGAEKRG